MESGGLTFCFFSEGFYRNLLFQMFKPQNYCSAMDRYYSFPVVKQNIEENYWILTGCSHLLFFSCMALKHQVGVFDCGWCTVLSRTSSLHCRALCSGSAQLPREGQCCPGMISLSSFPVPAAGSVQGAALQTWSSFPETSLAQMSLSVQGGQFS